MNQDQLSRPDKIRQAVTLLYVNLGIGVLIFIMEVPFSQRWQVASVYFIMFIVLCIFWFFIHMIGKGKNWARITYLVLFIIGMPFWVLELPQSLAANPIVGLLGIGETVIQVVALVILFQKPSSDWFREMKDARQVT